MTKIHKIQNTSRFVNLNIDILNFFRISDFGFRIS